MDLLGLFGDACASDGTASSDHAHGQCRIEASGPTCARDVRSTGADDGVRVCCCGEVAAASKQKVLRVHWLVTDAWRVSHDASPHGSRCGSWRCGRRRLVRVAPVVVLCDPAFLPCWYVRKTAPTARSADRTPALRGVPSVSQYADSRQISVATHSSVRAARARCVSNSYKTVRIRHVAM
eukprot:247068-Prymnesium_polylepis.1